MIHNLEEIKKLRKKLELTQQQLAELSGVSQSFIAKVEAGKIEPSFEKVKDISFALEQVGQKNRQKLTEVMTKKIVTCKKETKVSGIIKKMKKFNISQLPVVENSQVLGLVSESTLMEKMAEGENIAELQAQDVMQEAPPIVDHRTQSSVVSNLLKHFPVVLVSIDGKVKGLISKYDMLAVASKVK